MTDERVGTQSALAAAVSKVPGVSRLYPAGTLVDRVVSRADDVAVSDDRIRIRIGITAGEAAAEVCRRVYTVARAWAETAGMTDAAIEITAAGIDG